MKTNEVTLPQDCEDKIRTALAKEGLADQFIDLFEQIVEHGQTNELPSVTVVLPMYDNDSGLEVGDWAAEIHLVGRKVIEVKEPEEEEDSA